MCFKSPDCYLCCNICQRRILIVTHCGFFFLNLRLIDDIVVINCGLHFLVTNSTFCSIYSLLSHEGVGLGFHSNVRRVN